MALHGKSLSSPSSNPLFSTIITLYTLILLYFPAAILFSPVFLSTSLLVLSILRLGATQKTNQHQRDPDCEDCNIPAQISPPSQISRDSSIHDCNSNVGPNPNRDPFYLQWSVRAPLEVIHEEYYEDEEEIRVVEKYGSLSLYYLDSDMDTGTDSWSDGDSPVIGKWDLPENLCFEWEEEEDRQGLIEIELDGKRNSEVEEENMIEINLTPANFPAR